MTMRVPARSEPRHDHDAPLMARSRIDVNRLDRARRRTGWLVNLLLLVLVLGVLVLAIVVWRQRQRMEGGGTPSATPDSAAALAPGSPSHSVDGSEQSQSNGITRAIMAL